MWNGGTLKQVKSYMNLSDKHEGILMNIYLDALKRSGKFKSKPRSFINDMLRAEMDKKEDVYLLAKEAIKWGFADGIFNKF